MWRNSTACCGTSSSSCDVKSVEVHVTKWGDPSFLRNRPELGGVTQDRRTYLKHTVVYIWSDGQYGSDQFTFHDKITGQITTQGELIARPGVPPPTVPGADPGDEFTVSVTADRWTWVKF